MLFQTIQLVIKAFNGDLLVAYELRKLSRNEKSPKSFINITFKENKKIHTDHVEEKFYDKKTHRIINFICQQRNQHKFSPNV